MDSTRRPELAHEPVPQPQADLRSWAGQLAAWLSRLLPRLATQAMVEERVQRAIAAHLEAEH